MPIVIFVIVTAVVLVIAWWRVFLRIGWSPTLALLMPIPIVNLVIMMAVAWLRWPIEQRLDALQTDLKRMRGEL